MYAVINFKSKKEFKTAVDEYNAVQNYIKKYGDDGGPYQKGSLKINLKGKP